MCLKHVFSLLLLSPTFAFAQGGVWRFAVSGDSRNCGDIVMPAIASGVLADNAQFYWHLGDFRAIYCVDEDYAQIHQKNPACPSVSKDDAYSADSWNDFIQNQLLPFGDLPVFLSLGNHEDIPPKDHNQVIAQFADWFNSSPIRNQRLADDRSDHLVKGYYHWLAGGIDFITLDNSSNAFDEAQLSWLHDLLDRDARNFSVRGIVVGMHAALPGSISADHSMNQSEDGVKSGNAAADWLVGFKVRTGKPVYVLASHSHFYLEGIFNTTEWARRQAILPGWIVGTAGAFRYELPANAANAKDARANTYGYLLGTVDLSQPDPVKFEFRELSEGDVPRDVVARFTAALVHECWVNNKQP